MAHDYLLCRVTIHLRSAYLNISLSPGHSAQFRIDETPLLPRKSFPTTILACFTLSHDLFPGGPKLALYSQCVFEGTEAQRSHVTDKQLVRLRFS